MDRDSLKSVVNLLFDHIEEESRRANVGGKDTPMRRIHQDQEVREGSMLDLDEIAREGARRMLAPKPSGRRSRRRWRPQKANATNTVTPS